jgi:hypothetical protein
MSLRNRGSIVSGGALAALAGAVALVALAHTPARSQSGQAAGWLCAFKLACGFGAGGATPSCIIGWDPSTNTNIWICCTGAGGKSSQCYYTGNTGNAGCEGNNGTSGKPTPVGCSCVNNNGDCTAGCGTVPAGGTAEYKTCTGNS